MFPSREASQQPSWVPIKERRWHNAVPQPPAQRSAWRQFS